MPGLILKLRAHEQILVNGVVMQNGDRNARLIVKTPDAKILRLRDAIHPEEATTPVKRVCYIAQLAVAGEADPEETQSQLKTGIRQLRAALDGIDGLEALDAAEFSLDQGNFYAALRSLRKLIPIEEELLDAATSAAAEAADLTCAHGKRSIGAAR
jgi:flagellar protein FlbT